MQPSTQFSIISCSHCSTLALLSYVARVTLLSFPLVLLSVCLCLSLLTAGEQHSSSHSVYIYDHSLQVCLKPTDMSGVLSQSLPLCMVVKQSQARPPPKKNKKNPDSHLSYICNEGEERRELYFNNKNSKIPQQSRALFSSHLESCSDCCS